MKKLAVITVCLAFLVAVAGCSSETKEWEKASELGTVSAYQAFLDKHPDGEFAEQARAVLMELQEAADWDAAVAAGDTTRWLDFIEKWYDSPRIHGAETELTALRNLLSARRMIALTALQWFAFVPHPLLDGVSVADTLLLQSSAMWGLSISNIVSTFTVDGPIPGAVFYGESSGPSIFSTKNMAIEKLANGIGFKFGDQWDTPYIVMSDGLPMVEFRTGQIVLSDGRLEFGSGLEARVKNKASASDTTYSYYVFYDDWNLDIDSHDANQESDMPSN